MDDLKVDVYPHGREADAVEWPQGRPEVEIKDRGCKLVLIFEDMSGEGNVVELRLLPDTKALEPRVLRQFAPQAELYLASARAAMGFKRDDLSGAIEALREVGRPGRGLTGKFYRVIAERYEALVTEGEPHPVKALGEIHHVAISTASRWITEARRRGLVQGKGRGR